MSASSTETTALAGQTVVITGANAGIGRVTARTLASQGARVILACRSRERTQPVLDEIARAGGDAHFVALDLASLDAVRQAASEIRDANPTIDLLINNAGLAGQRGETKDGFELAFGVNHLGHFLLTAELMDAVRKAKAPRIVHVASRAHTRAFGIPWERVRGSTRSFTGLREYSVSKLANVLFCRELARREQTRGSGVITHSLHPGVVATDIWRRLPPSVESLAKRFMITEEEGARTTLHCATSADAGSSTGDYWDKCARKRASRVAHDDTLALALWERSAAWCGAEP